MLWRLGKRTLRAKSPDSVRDRPAESHCDAMDAAVVTRPRASSDTILHYHPAAESRTLGDGAQDKNNFWRSVSSLFNLNKKPDAVVIAVEGIATPIAPEPALAGSSASDVQPELPAPPAPDRTADVLASLLQTALADADASLRAAQDALERTDIESGAQIGEYMNRNAQLRRDEKQATRRVLDVEAELAQARKRIAELEQALTDAALAGASPDELDAHGVERSTKPVASLGTGHGGFDLTRSPSPPPGGASPPNSGGGGGRRIGAEVEVESLLQDVVSSPSRASGGQAVGKARPSEPDESPARLSLRDAEPAPTGPELASGKKGSCCAIS